MTDKPTDIRVLTPKEEADAIAFAFMAKQADIPLLHFLYEVFSLDLTDEQETLINALIEKFEHDR